MARYHQLVQCARGYGHNLGGLAGRHHDAQSLHDSFAEGPTELRPLIEQCFKNFVQFALSVPGAFEELAIELGLPSAFESGVVKTDFRTLTVDLLESRRHHAI